MQEKLLVHTLGLRLLSGEGLHDYLYGEPGNKTEMLLNQEHLLGSPLNKKTEVLFGFVHLAQAELLAYGLDVASYPEGDLAGFSDVFAASCPNL